MQKTSHVVGGIWQQFATRQTDEEGVELGLDAGRLEVTRQPRHRRYAFAKFGVVPAQPPHHRQ